MVAYACNPSYSRGEGRRVTVPDQFRKKYKTLSENKLKEKGLSLRFKW
jgi:hypothetical protein